MNSDALPNLSSQENLGQKYAFALASLALGITSFVNLLGVEKAILAIGFGLLAMRPPVARNSQSWAKAGMILGGVMIILVLFFLVLFNEEIFRLIEQLNIIA